MDLSLGDYRWEINRESFFSGFVPSFLDTKMDYSTRYYDALEYVDINNIISGCD